MKTRILSMLDKIAKDNNYCDKAEMLRDYNIIPTVLMPKHKKIEFILLLHNHIRQKH